VFDWTFCCTVVSLTSSCCYHSCYTIVIISSSKGKFQSLFGFSTLILFINWLALVYVAKFDTKVYKEPPSFGTAFVGYALHCCIDGLSKSRYFGLYYYYYYFLCLSCCTVYQYSASLLNLLNFGSCFTIASDCLLASWCIFHTSSGALMWHRQMLLLH
jgi:hypothetical protein